jgi:hypothetical protein
MLLLGVMLFIIDNKGDIMIDLLTFRKNIYSAEGEDGILEEIFNILNIKNGFFCEFGAWDGIVGSNTRAFLEKKWKGVYIESDYSKFLECQKNTKNYNDNVVCINSSVSHENETSKLDYLLKDTFLPKDFDLLSIDIDSSDYQIWESLENYKPKLVIIEIDSRHDENAESIYNFNEKTTSFKSMLQLATKKDYKLLCSTGNMFFLRNDIDFPEVNAYHQGMDYYRWRS